jgi:hypothetical protein
MPRAVLWQRVERLIIFSVGLVLFWHWNYTMSWWGAVLVFSAPHWRAPKSALLQSPPVTGSCCSGAAFAPPELDWIAATTSGGSPLLWWRISGAIFLAAIRAGF